MNLTGLMQRKEKDLRLHNLEEELLKSHKANEQDLTILKLHIIQIEKALDNILRESKSLTQDINHLEAKTCKRTSIIRAD